LRRYFSREMFPGQLGFVPAPRIARRPSGG